MPRLCDTTRDLGELYQALSRPLENCVRTDVQASEAVVEEACQFAWSRLVHHAARIQRETALSWLVKTAVHEAYKLLRRDQRCVSLDAVVEAFGDQALCASAPALDQLVSDREQLASIATLPERQQRLLWLHGLGFSYAEVAQCAGVSPRTVERELVQARNELRQLTLP